MGTVNYLDTQFACPYCSMSGHFEFELRLGLRNQIRFRPGDLYVWVPRKEVQNGGRPPDGNIDTSAYATCDNCGRDFFVTVRIQNDVLGEPDPLTIKAGYMSSTEP